MNYQHKNLHFFITKKEYESLTDTQKSDFINHRNLKEQEYIKQRFLKKQEAVYQKNFRHFAMRLLERYKISIIYSEYVSLCQLPYIHNQKLVKKPDSFPFYKGYVMIKDVKVFVYRDAGTYKSFLTAIKKIS